MRLSRSLTHPALGADSTALIAVRAILLDHGLAVPEKKYEIAQECLDDFCSILDRLVTPRSLDVEV